MELLVQCFWGESHIGHIQRETLTCYLASVGSLQAESQNLVFIWSLHKLIQHIVLAENI